MSAHLPPALLRAFRGTRCAAGPHTVRIGRRCPALDVTLGRRGGAFVTAWNPWGRRAPDECSRRMNAALPPPLRWLPRWPGAGQRRLESGG